MAGAAKTEGGLRDVALVLLDDELVVLPENVFDVAAPFTGARGGRGGGPSDESQIAERIMN